MTLVPWLRHHPLLGYFALAYGIRWGGILIVLNVMGFNLVELRPVDTGIIFCAYAGASDSAMALESRVNRRCVRCSPYSIARSHVPG
jgi:hypothetical protein